jgi:hypothetical protein
MGRAQAWLQTAQPSPAPHPPPPPAPSTAQGLPPRPTGANTLVAGAASMAPFFGPGAKSTALGAPGGGYGMAGGFPGVGGSPLPPGANAVVAVRAGWGAGGASGGGLPFGPGRVTGAPGVGGFGPYA